MTIHQVSVDGPTAALLREAALAFKMTLLDFEAQVLGVWADAYCHRQQTMLAIIDAEDSIGVIPGGD